MPKTQRKAARPRDDRGEAIDAALASLRRAMGATFGRRRRAIADRGMSPPQFFVIKVLAAGQVSTPKDLAGALGVTPGNITGLIEKLERDGFVARERDAKDRRVVRLKLTAKAEKGLSALRTAAHAEAAKAFEGWSTKDIVRLQGFLERLGGDDPRCGPMGGWGKAGFGGPWAMGAPLREERRRPRARP